MYVGCLVPSTGGGGMCVGIVGLGVVAMSGVVADKLLMCRSRWLRWLLVVPVGVRLTLGINHETFQYSCSSRTENMLWSR